MGLLKILLRDGEELALERPLSIEEAIDAKPRLKKLHEKLIERFKRDGMVAKDAEDAATREVENLLLVALSELGEAYVKGKSAALKKLVQVHGQIQEMYRGVLRGRELD